MNKQPLSRREFLLATATTTAGLTLAACKPLPADRPSQETPKVEPTMIEPRETQKPKATSNPRKNSWKVIGPGGGGAMFSPSISPHDPRVVFLHCDMTGAYVTKDQGDSWRMFNLRGVVRFFAFDPSNPETVYACSCGLWRSLDGGERWELIHPDPAQVIKIVHVGDHAEDIIITSDSSDRRMEALTIDPENSHTLYCVMTSNDVSAFYSSGDWGQTWQASEELPNGGLKIYVDPVSPPDDRTIYITSKRSISLRRQGQWTHHQPPEGLDHFNSISAGFSPEDGKITFYAVASPNWTGEDSAVTSIFISRDEGETWDQVGVDFLSEAAKGSALLELRAIATCIQQPKIVYLSYKDVSHQVPTSRRTMGVVRSTDGGQTWEFVWQDTENQAGENIKDAWLNERFGPYWGENPFDLDVAPTNPDICYGSDFGRTMRTLDGGKTWEGVYSRSLEDGSWTTRGLDVTTCHNVHFDPFNLERIFLDYTDIGLVLSENGGMGWLSATTQGVPQEWINTTYWMEFDPEVQGLVWAVMSMTHDLPRPKMWRRGGTASYKGGVLASNDGGKSWKVCRKGLPQMAATHILLDPLSQAGQRTLYVCGFGKGVYKTTDNGASWTLKNQGIEGPTPFAWRLERASDGMLYLVIARRSDDGNIGNDGDGALYCSKDGAETWEKLALPEGCNGPTSLIVDPQDENRLLLSAWGRKNLSGDIGGGIYLSLDRGKTWSYSLDRDQHIHDLSFNPRNNTFYACGFESNAFRSIDRGATWQRIKGYNFKWGRRVIPDPKNSKMVYIATFGGSVWYGPEMGDPQAEEDIMTPEVAYTA